jgi:hypothetical protein
MQRCSKDARTLRLSATTRPFLIGDDLMSCIRGRRW